MCTPGTGVNLWGESPLYVSPVNWLSLTQVLADNKGGTARDRPKGLSIAKGESQARVTAGNGPLERKTMSRRTETAYKAWSPGESAQHDKAHDGVRRVKQFIGQGYTVAVDTDLSKMFR